MNSVLNLFVVKSNSVIYQRLENKLFHLLLISGCEHIPMNEFYVIVVELSEKSIVYFGVFHKFVKQLLLVLQKLLTALFGDNLPLLWIELLAKFLLYHIILLPIFHYKILFKQFLSKWDEFQIQMGKYQFDGESFNSIQKAKEHIRNIFKTVGICKSVKAKDQKTFQRLALILTRNVKAIEKGLIDQNGQIACKDLQITENFKKDWAVNIIKDNDEKQDISWTRCVNPSQKTNQQKLTQAMRSAIYPQILDFKMANPQKKCEICQTDVALSYHVDHVVPFRDIKKDFLKINNQKVEVFDDDDKTNMKKFRKVDNQYEKSWQDHHRKTAKLRWLCQTCNLQRSKK